MAAATTRGAQRSLKSFTLIPRTSSSITSPSRYDRHSSLHQPSLLSTTISTPFSTASTNPAESTFPSTSTSQKGDLGTEKSHITDRTPHDSHLNVQSGASQSGQSERMNQHGSKEAPSQATSQKDQRNSNERAKKEHPEAPEPVIGMNEERGGKGF